MSTVKPPPYSGPPYTGPGSPQDVPPAPGSFPIDPETLPKRIRAGIQAHDPLAIDTSAKELQDGVNRCPKCGSTAIRQKPGSDALICLFWPISVEPHFGQRLTPSLSSLADVSIA